MLEMVRDRTHLGAEIGFLGVLHFHRSLAKIADEAFFSRFLQPLRNKDWVVYAKPPFGGPEQVLKYLACYVAISNHRLAEFRDRRGLVMNFALANDIENKLISVTFSAGNFRAFVGKARNRAMACWHAEALMNYSQTRPLSGWPSFVNLKNKSAPSRATTNIPLKFLPKVKRVERLQHNSFEKWHWEYRQHRS